MNTICLMGRLVADPEIKVTQSGKSVTNATMAVDRGYGENKTTDFIPIVAWNKTAESIANFFTKGNKIAITGTLTTEKYEDKDGNKRTAFRVLVNSFFFCEGSNNTSEDKTPQNRNESVTVTSNDTDDFTGIDVNMFDDLDLDLPF